MGNVTAKGQGSMHGTQLGSYELIRRLGEGGMAQVYLARDVRLGREVAVKVLDSQLAQRSSFRKRFLHEAQVAAGLEHPNIVPLYDYGESSGVLFLVMPYLSGGSLQQMLKRTPFSVSDVVTYGTQITDALAYAHQKGVIHRDVKPANMLLHADGRLMLGDFGLAKIFDGTPRPSRNGKPDAGTPEYMAPEQIRGQSDPRSDLYGLGVVLYLLLTGRLPFSDASSEGVMEEHLYRQAPSPRSINPRVTPAVESVVMRALAKNPDERYQRASEMGAALLEALLAGNAEPLPFASGPSAGSIFSQPSVLPDGLPEIAGNASSQGPLSQGFPNSRAPRSGGQGGSSTSYLPSLDVPQANSHLSSNPAGSQGSLPTDRPYSAGPAPSFPGGYPGGYPTAQPMEQPFGQPSGYPFSPVPGARADAPSRSPSIGTSGRATPERHAPDYSREHLPTRPLAGSALPGEVALVEPLPLSLSLGTDASMGPGVAAISPRGISAVESLDDAPRGHRRIFWIVIVTLLLIMLLAVGALAVVFWITTGHTF